MGVSEVLSGALEKALDNERQRGDPRRKNKENLGTSAVAPIAVREVVIMLCMFEGAAVLVALLLELLAWCGAEEWGAILVHRMPGNPSRPDGRGTVLVDGMPGTLSRPDG